MARYTRERMGLIDYDAYYGDITPPVYVQRGFDELEIPNGYQYDTDRYDHLRLKPSNRVCERMQKLVNGLDDRVFSDTDSLPDWGKDLIKDLQVLKEGFRVPEGAEPVLMEEWAEATPTDDLFHRIRFVEGNRTLTENQERFLKDNGLFSDFDHILYGRFYTNPDVLRSVQALEQNGLAGDRIRVCSVVVRNGCDYNIDRDKAAWNKGAFSQIQRIMKKIDPENLEQSGSDLPGWFNDALKKLKDARDEYCYLKDPVEAWAVDNISRPVEHENEETVRTNQGVMNIKEYRVARLEDADLTIIQVPDVTPMKETKDGLIPLMEYNCRKEASIYDWESDRLLDELKMAYCMEPLDFHGLQVDPGEFYGVNGVTREFVVVEGNSRDDGKFDAQVYREGKWEKDTLDLSDFSIELKRDWKKDFPSIDSLDQKKGFTEWFEEDILADKQGEDYDQAYEDYYNEGSSLVQEYQDYFYGDTPDFIRQYLDQGNHYLTPDLARCYSAYLNVDERSLVKSEDPQFLTQKAAEVLIGHYQDNPSGSYPDNIYGYVVEAKDIMERLNLEEHSPETFPGAVTMVHQINTIWGETPEKTAALYAVAKAGTFRETWKENCAPEVVFSLPKTKDAIREYDEVLQDLQNGEHVYLKAASYDDDYKGGYKPESYLTMPVDSIPVRERDSKLQENIDYEPGEYTLPSIQEEMVKQGFVFTDHAHAEEVIDPLDLNDQEMDPDDLEIDENEFQFDDDMEL